MSLADKLDKIECFILSGDLTNAARAVKAIHKREKIAYNRLARFGNLANRCGEFQTSMNSLFKFSNEQEDDPEILKEYATAILFIGCRRRATQIMQYLMDQGMEEALFLKGICHMKSWQLEAAADAFKRYSELSQISDYQKRVGQLNLLFSLNSMGNHRAAYELAAEVMASPEISNSQRLLLNGQQMLLQVLFGLENWDELERLMTKMEQKRKNFSSEEDYSFQRWQLLLEYKKTNNLKLLKLQMRQLIKKMAAKKHYELVRACEFYLARYTQDFSKATQLFFGTPYPHFRKFISDLFPDLLSQDSYLHKLNSEKVSSVLDLKYGSLNDSELFSRQPILFKTLQAIFSDLYRPFSVYEIFEIVFEDETFNPESSHNKVRAAVNRLNLYLKSQKLSLNIISRKMNYFYLCDGALAVKYYQRNDFSNEDQIWGKIKDISQYGNFKVKDVTSQLNLSERKVLRLINEYVEEGKIVKLGNGRNTRYRIAS